MEVSPGEAKGGMARQPEQLLLDRSEEDNKEEKEAVVATTSAWR